MAALTPGILWIQDAWRLRSLPLQDFEVERRRNGKELALTPGHDPSGEKLTLTFASAAEGGRWYDQIQALRFEPIPDAGPDDRLVPEGVALVRRAPDVPHVDVGRVAFMHRTPEEADRGIQLRAGMRRADAIIGLRREKCPEMGRGARRVSGLAIRVPDADDRRRLRWKWYAEEVSALVNRMLTLILIQGGLLFFAITSLTGKSRFIAATGETFSESLVSAGLGLGLFFACPLVLIVLVRALSWRELLRAAGLAVLAVTAGRGLTACLVHLLAVHTTGADLAQSGIGLLADPVEWAFVLFGAVLCVRAWRLAARASQILPEEAQVTSVARKFSSRGVLAATAAYSLFCLGLLGFANYQQEVHLLQPGVDPRREQEALLAFNEGARRVNSGDLAAAEESFRRSLRLWETLTNQPPAPPAYRVNLALTLNNLGWIRQRQARGDEAEKFYGRAVALADELANDPHLDEEAKQALDEARDVLSRLRRGKSGKLHDEKAAEAARKYEEGEVKSATEGPQAERLFREAIALWEEVLPHATNEDYRKRSVAQLATACLRLGELQGQLGSPSASEASLKKGIEYGERAVELDPTRPLPRHNLQVARRLLEGLHDQAFQEQINKLTRTNRFADAIGLFARSIKEQEERARSPKDQETAVPSLASRLDRFAWLLAHCPDRRLRDTKTAVEHARRATGLRSDVGDYWYTLAMVQYRNGDWMDSLATLDRLKVAQGELDACDWLLSAMNLHRLDRRAEAGDAMRKANAWIDERSRKAEGDPILRMEYEMMWPAIETLLREAKGLIEGERGARQSDA
jgi:tetratricopeptide (TPR) repeat protein